jgi:hypothetical protein
VSQRERDAGTSFAGGASAHGIDHDHQGSGPGIDGGVHIGWGSQLPDPKLRKFLPHWFDEEFWIRHDEVL